MKTIFVLAGAGLVALLAGCATTPVPVAPVGPNPSAARSDSSRGGLQVFSRLARHSDEQNQGSSDPNPQWYQHTAYEIFDLQGNLVSNVQNRPHHYDDVPDLVRLPPGQYTVKAESADYFWVQVPVKIETGKTTNLHLDGRWSPPPGTPDGDIIKLPDGRPVGWKETGGE